MKKTLTQQIKEPLLSLKDVWKIYRMGEVEVPALKGITLDINRGDFVAVTGASGSGKSTMMNLMGCLDIPTRGHIYLKSKDISAMSLFLVAIAAVSLLVGAIGVANTMFTSVLEKTKEIGIMKAIGARNRDIMMIFLLNAALIGFIGGMLGVLSGAALSSGLSSMIGSSPITRGGGIVSLNSVILALSVSVGAGIIAGMIPAYQASRLKPVDALRFE